MRRIPFVHLHNLRELGGIPISLEKEITAHQFLRSDAILELSKEEIDFLKNYGIKVIIDLRNDFEIKKKPNILAKNPDFFYYSVPFLNDTQVEDNKGERPSKDLSEKSLYEIYIDIFDNHKGQIKRFFEIIANHLDVGILYHCSAGKDRTGILTALLLSLAGVARLDILADYEVSYTFLLPRLRKLQSTFPNLPMHIMASDAECLDKALTYVEKKYGSLDNYIRIIGVSDDEIQHIKNKLTK